MSRSLLASALFIVSAAASAASAGGSAVQASAGWIRLLPGNLLAGAYVTFDNHADKALAIVDAQSADFGHAMIHRSSTEGGMGRMEMVDSVALPANGKVSFSPGGYHVMLMDAKHPVKPGDKLTITFRLSDGASLPVVFVARPANATGPAD